MKDYKKIGVFGGDLFWSNLPYEALSYFNKIKRQFKNVSLILFEKDIRINKKFSGEENFFFDKEHYLKCESLILVKNWQEFYRLTGEFDIIYASCKLAPKTRFPVDIMKNLKCEMRAWDIGGVDILVDSQFFASQWMVKGPVWKKYLLEAPRSKMSPDKIKIDTCPLYERYFRQNIKIDPVAEREDFFKKYQLDKEKKTLLITPSNPGSHREMFQKNIRIIDKVVSIFYDKDFQILIKTYPHDYLFYEPDSSYTGVYKRRNFLDDSKPQYEFLKEHLGSERVKILESQDHHESILYSDALYNMSGSSISWETFYSKCVSFSIGLSNQPFYKKLSYLPDAYFPDEEFNIDFDNIQELREKFNTLLSRSDQYKNSEFVKSFF